MFYFGEKKQKNISTIADVFVFTHRKALYTLLAISSAI